MRAAEMIDDAENALRMLEECENEGDFRVLWIACVTILRSMQYCNTYYQLKQALNHLLEVQFSHCQTMFCQKIMNFELPSMKSG